MAKESDQYGNRETTVRIEAAFRRALGMPHKPNQAFVGKNRSPIQLSTSGTGRVADLTVMQDVAKAAAILSNLGKFPLSSATRVESIVLKLPAI